MFIVIVPAGYPSPAEDYAEGPLDLNQHLIVHPSATFFVRVKGDSMTGAGIHSGDLLIVDRAVTATSGHIIIAIVNGDLTVKRLHQAANVLQLLPDNPSYSPIEIYPDSSFIFDYATLRRVVDIQNPQVGYHGESREPAFNKIPLNSIE